MASYNLAPIGNGFQFLTTGGLPLNAGQIFTYAAGTSTPQATYTTSAGSIANANPIILGVDGRPPSEIWLTSGISYKFVLEDSLGNILGTYDNLTGINDVVTAASEWLATGYAPTYIGPASFSVVGDRTTTYQQYRRIKATVSGGSIYGTITNTVFAAGVTTVTVVMDSTSLDNSLTAVDVAFLSATNASVPGSLTFAGPINETQGANIASAATINLTTATGNYVHVTGSTTITAITLANGYERTVVFDGSLTLTNGASLVLPTGGNIQTQAGDVAIFRGDAGSVVRCVSYLPANGLTQSIQGAFSNLQASATGLSATITVTADEIAVENSSHAYQTLRAVSLSINSAASGANGLDTGTLATSTWYSVWVIWNGSTTAGLISISATAPTMPSGYTHKARVGWVRTDGTANKYPFSFKQTGKLVQYVVSSGGNLTALPILISGTQGSVTVPTWVAASVSSSVPTTAGSIRLVCHSNGNTTIVAPNNSYGAAASGTNPPPMVSSATGAIVNSTANITLESTNVYYASDNTGGALACLGWEDNL